MKKILLITLVFGLMISSCKKPSSKKNTNTEKSQKEVTVLVNTVKPKTLDKYIEVAGTLEGINDVSLISETSGKIASLNVKLGDWVKKGQALGKVDNNSFKINLDMAKAQVKAAKAGLQAAKLSLDAAKSLFAKGNMSKAELALANSKYKQSESQFESAKAASERAKLAYDNSLFVAPISGYVAQLLVQKGQFVSPSMPIAQIVNNKMLKIKTGVSEQDISYMQKNQKAIVTFNNKQYQAVISGIGIKPFGSLYPIEIKIPNPKGLYPGMVVKVKVHSKSFKNVIYTSINHIVKNYDQNYVYVVKNNQALKRKVTLGEKVSENVIIKSGLVIGEKMVIEGMDNIESGVKVIAKEIKL